ncbi:hypothetical protein FOA52_012405 [Chlamydomonas sp. UWO 241]|nr:hypothetical protein FOA52_012405 [Chlamydomonas sp. UWO 241]
MTSLLSSYFNKFSAGVSTAAQRHADDYYDSEIGFVDRPADDATSRGRTQLSVGSAPAGSIPMPAPPGGKHAAARRPPLPESMLTRGGSLPITHGLAGSASARPSDASRRSSLDDNAQIKSTSARPSMDATRASIDEDPSRRLVMAALFAALAE